MISYTYERHRQQYQQQRQQYQQQRQNLHKHQQLSEAKIMMLTFVDWWPTQ